MIEEKTHSYYGTLEGPKATSDLSETVLTEELTTLGKILAVVKNFKTNFSEELSDLKHITKSIAQLEVTALNERLTQLEKQLGKITKIVEKIELQTLKVATLSPQKSKK